MSEEQNTSEPEKQPEPQTTQPTSSPKPEAKPQPSISPEDLARQVAGNLDIAGEVKKSLQALVGGEKPKKQTNPLHEAFLEDPATLLNNVKELAKREIKEEEEQIKTQNARRKQELGPIAKEYSSKHPSLQTTAGNHLVEIEFANILDSNPDKSEKEAFKEACDKAVAHLESLGIKSPTEEERKRAEQAAQMPPMAHPGLPSARNGFNPAKSADDYIKQQQEFRAKFKQPQSK